MIEAELFARFLLISLIAFGGGQAALPLIERVAVQDAGWITSAAFGSAVAFGYLTPGPVLITATFVGQQVAGLSGGSPPLWVCSSCRGRCRPQLRSK